MFVDRTIKSAFVDSLLEADSLVAQPQFFQSPGNDFGGMFVIFDGDGVRQPRELFDIGLLEAPHHHERFLGREHQGMKIVVSRGLVSSDVANVLRVLDQHGIELRLSHACHHQIVASAVFAFRKSKARIAPHRYCCGVVVSGLHRDSPGD